jgi:hypothetical protein
MYGFLQGAWPFGLIEAIWAAVIDTPTNLQQTKFKGSMSLPE